MSDQILYCGIDISAHSFNICVLQPEGNFIADELPNNASGFKQLLKLCSKDYHFVMEATGAFHLPLCFFFTRKKMSLQRGKCTASKTLYPNEFRTQ
jgi:transposase